MSNSQIPIYILNLKAQPERKLFMQRQLDAFGLSYEFFDTEDINKWAMRDDNYLKQICDNLYLDYDAVQRKRKALNDHLKEGTGYIANGLAHFKVHNHIVRNHSVACVLEDDCKLLPSFPEVIEKAVSYPLRNHWDVLLMASLPSYPRFDEMIEPMRISGEDRESINKNVLEAYSFDDTNYPEQTKYMLGILNEYHEKASYLGKINGIYWWPFMCEAETRLGAPGRKDNFRHMTDFHLFSYPTHMPYLTMAYLVKSNVLETWKTLMFNNNAWIIDHIPWFMYKKNGLNTQVLTPPCAHQLKVYSGYSQRGAN